MLVKSKSPTLHVVGLPHTATNGDFGCCAYTGKVLRFCDMMGSGERNGRRWKVIHYGNEGSAVRCEHVQVFTEADRQQAFGGESWFQRGEYYAGPWGGAGWAWFNAEAVRLVRERAKPGDFLCLIGGLAQRSIADELPQLTPIEYGIGYEGVFSTRRAFESYAWMHHVYGLTQQKDGSAFDAVIPNYYDPAEFPLNAGRRDSYLLFMSRMTHRKGYGVALDIARRTGRKLVIAGIGGDVLTDPLVEHVGYADAKRRAELMGNAHALLVPTQYIEPFGGVAVEAMLCGTPAITSDFGAFTETVEHGVSGYRCRTMSQYVAAVDAAVELTPSAVRAHAVARYSLDRVGRMFDEWLRMLGTLHGDGFYSSDKPDLGWLAERSGNS